MHNNTQSKTLEMSKWQLRVALVVALLLVGGMAVAAPVTIDFDDTLPTVAGLSTYSEDGMTINSNVASGTLIDQNDIVRQNIGIFSGGTSSQTMFWGDNSAQSTLTMTADNGKRFSISSLDASSLYNPAGTLTLIGTKAGGGTVSTVLNLNSALSTYAVSGLGLVTSLELTFDGTVEGAPYDLDNVNLNVVPIPAAVWLFGSALGLLGWIRRGNRTA